jgi:uncharacterized protein
MTHWRVLVLLGFAAQASHAQAQTVTSQDVTLYSEAVQCTARLHTPENHSASNNAAGVVLAPGEAGVRTDIDRYAQALARRGIVALAIDYRGWGACGGFLYFGEPVRWDDRLRFMQMTANMRIRRGRIDPQAQLTDIRNAMTFLQGVPGVDRTRIGVWGTDLAGGHAITLAAIDARTKVVVAQAPVIAGHGLRPAAFAPSAAQQATMIKLARTGPPATEREARWMNDAEAKLALARYRPFTHLEQIPPATAIAFIVAEHDERVNNATNAIAAAERLKGPKQVTTIAGAKHSLAGKEDHAAAAAADWFAKHL